MTWRAGCVCVWWRVQDHVSGVAHREFSVDHETVDTAFVDIGLSGIAPSLKWGGRGGLIVAKRGQ